MSGHSKWHSIKHGKAIVDAKRGKVFTKHAKLITIATREGGGGDPAMNPALRTAIINARADNVPNLNIEKAIKKGTGEDKGAAQIEEVIYEGYGPGGIAFLIQAITDNKNRVIGNIKSIFLKHGGSIAEPGSVGWMFAKKGLIFALTENKNPEEAELEAIDAGAEDISVDGSEFEIITEASKMAHVRDNLEKAGFKIEKAELIFVPKNVIKVDVPEKAQKVLSLVEALEDDEDVSNVYGNFDIPD